MLKKQTLRVATCNMAVSIAVIADSVFANLPGYELRDRHGFPCVKENTVGVINSKSTDSLTVSDRHSLID